MESERDVNLLSQMGKVLLCLFNAMIHGMPWRSTGIGFVVPIQRLHTIKEVAIAQGVCIAKANLYGIPSIPYSGNFSKVRG